MAKLNEDSFWIKRLIEIGFLVPFDASPLYHGRANTTGEEFRVDPTRAGVGSFLPNMSLTTDYEGAKYVAESRSGDKYIPEIHRMMSLGGKYYFVNTDMRLSVDTRGMPLEYYEVFSTRMAICNGVRHMEELSLNGINETFPIAQNMQDVYEQVYQEFASLINNEHPFLLKNDIDSVLVKILENNKSHRAFIKNPEKFKADVSEIVTMFAGSINARTWLLDNPGMAIFGYMQKPPKNSNLSTSGLSGRAFSFTARNISAGLFKRLKDEYQYKDIPINWEYLATWLKKNNIVGGISTRDSDTVGKKLPVYFLLDLDTVKTESEQSQVYEQIINKYGDLISDLSQISSDEEVGKLLADASPEVCIDFINRSKRHPDLAKLSSGTWEGYTVGEHTEAALRLYEENFARTLPEELQPFMKLTILLHDIGKGVAVQKRKSGSRATEQEETDKVCKDLFDEFGIDPKAAELISFIISDSQAYTMEFYVLRNASAEQRLLDAIKIKYRKIFGVEPSEKQINGIASMCKILQTCDSYSYSPEAVIRRQTENGDVYISGANAEFANNSVRGRNTLEYTRPDGGEHASDPYSTPGKRKK